MPALATSWLASNESARRASEGRPGLARLTPQHLDAARAQLGRFLAVGVLERLDDFAEVLEYVVG